jgi:hypothetical protein
MMTTPTARTTIATAFFMIVPSAEYCARLRAIHAWSHQRLVARVSGSKSSVRSALADPIWCRHEIHRLRQCVAVARADGVAIQCRGSAARRPRAKRWCCRRRGERVACDLAGPVHRQIPARGRPAVGRSASRGFRLGAAKRQRSARTNRRVLGALHHSPNRTCRRVRGKRGNASAFIGRLGAVAVEGAARAGWPRHHAHRRLRTLYRWPAGGSQWCRG